MAIEERIEKGVLLAPFTTFKIGGPAKFFVEANTSEEIIESIEWAKAHGEGYFLLGGGSNILVSDQGFNGLIIKNSTGQFFREVNSDGEMIDCDGGVPLSKVVQHALRNSLKGMEWAVGVPGSVGGAVRGNAACFGSEMAAVVSAVEAYDPVEGKRYEVSAKGCDFGYRTSLFKEKDLIVLKVKISLQNGDTDEINQKVTDIIKKRSDQQPKYPSAGSIFRNVPLELVSDHELLKLAKEKNKIVGAGNGGLPAAWLIENIHLKGKTMGGAMVSLEHANFLINKDFQATAEDVVMLISFIKQQVRLVYNIHLVEEIIYLGF